MSVQTLAGRIRRIEERLNAAVSTPRTNYAERVSAARKDHEARVARGESDPSLVDLIVDPFAPWESQQLTRRLNAAAARLRAQP